MYEKPFAANKVYLIRRLINLKMGSCAIDISANNIKIRTSAYRCLGSAPVKSLGGSQYYVTFIDDSTREVCVYFLKNKFDVFSVFKRWKKEIETQTGLKIKCLKSNMVENMTVVNLKSFVQRTNQNDQDGSRNTRTLNERAMYENHV